jgi:hypothetical protein
MADRDGADRAASGVEGGERASGVADMFLATIFITTGRSA